MIDINLLPYRQIRQRQDRRRLQLLLACMFSVGVLIVSSANVVLQLRAGTQQRKMQILQREHQQLDLHITQKDQVQQQLLQLTAHLAALDYLQQQRNNSVKLLSELALHVPSGIVLTAVRQDAAQLSLHGNAASYLDIIRMLSKFNETEILADAQLRHTTQTGERQTFFITVAKQSQPVAP